MKGNIVKTPLVGLGILFLAFLPIFVIAIVRQVINPGPNVNVSARLGNQSEATVVVNPTNSQQVFVASNDETTNPGLFMARSANGGINWTRGTIGTGAGGDGLPSACCDPSAAWDQFGNLFLTYLNQTTTQVELLLSTDGGVTFTSLGPIAMGDVDQPSTVTTGGGAVWVTFRDNAGMISARGAQVTGLGVVGAFNAAQTAPGSAGGNFGDIAIGPAGQVMVTYQIPAGGQGPATIFINVDADGLGAGGFGPSVTATTTNVGGFDFIPAQPDRSVDSEAGLAYDRSGGPRNGRVYLVYTEETPDESHDMDILVRFSDSNGAAGTWSAPVRVNDDATTNSQFLPRIALDQTTGDIAVSWHDARADGGTGPADADGPNNDTQLWGSASVDGGVNFLPNVQISSGTSDEDGAEPPAGGFADIDYGDYVGADFFNGNFYNAWADNSNSTGDNPNGTLNRLDIYFARSVLIEQADVEILKTESSDPVVAGTNLTYNLTVTNNGPGAATGVMVADTLPTGVTFVSATPSQGTCSVSGSIVTCNIGNLANGANATVTIVVNVNSSTPCGTTLTNTADVSGTEPDPNPGNNTASAVTAVICRADLAITKSAATDPVIAGTDETYNLTVTNNGPSDAQNVTLVDGTPANTTFVSFVRSMGPAFTCTTPPSGGIGNVMCTLATLPAGASATFAMVVHVSPSAPDGSTLSNTASVSSSTTDPNPGNNSTTVTTAVIARADLSVTKSQTSNLVIADTNQTYNFTVVNNGPSDAQNVTLSDPTPANTTFVSLAQNTGPVFTCAAPPPGGTGSVSCTLATLTAGASASFTMVVRISPVDTDSIKNTVSASSTTTDPNPANNAATVTALDSINAYKQSVLTDLIALRSTVTDKQIGQKLDKAIQDLSSSLDPSLWVDDNLLDAKRGDKVFTDEKDAVVFMSFLIRNNDGGLAGALQGLVSRLLAADHALADIAIHQAISAGGAPNHIAQAQDQLAQGDGSASNSIVAIEHYRNAWQHAQQAMQK